MSDQHSSLKLVRAGLLIDGSGNPPLENAAILINGSEIAAVGPQKEIPVPDGASPKLIDLSNKIVMPGMVDCHTHHNGFGDGRAGDDLAKLPDEILTLQSAKNARTSLFTGVTTIRENGPKNTTMLRLRDAIQQGISIGPRMVLCGRPISIIGGHMDYFGSAITGPTDGRAMVRQLVKEGADYIKITATGGTTKTSFPLLPSFNPDELSAIVDEAHKFGILTATHCTSTQGIVNSLDAKVDMIIHCIFREANGEFVFRQDIADRLANTGTFVNPTLHVIRTRVWSALELAAERSLTPSELTQLDEAKYGFETAIEHTHKLIGSGVNVITGSDSSWGNYKLGNTFYETECLSMAGMSNSNIIKSVTSEAAKSIDIADSVGSISIGKKADLISLENNPLDNLSSLLNISDVILGGKLLTPTSNESLDLTRQQRPDKE